MESSQQLQILPCKCEPSGCDGPTPVSAVGSTSRPACRARRPWACGRSCAGKEKNTKFTNFSLSLSTPYFSPVGKNQKANLGSQRNLSSWPSSLHISHSLKEAWLSMRLPSLRRSRKEESCSMRCANSPHCSAPPARAPAFTTSNSWAETPRLDKQVAC